jgi:NADH:ubiquinone oxidoreductase subunit 4 (subunit M)
MIFSLIFFILFSSIFFILFIPNSNLNLIRFISLVSSGLVFILSSSFLITFDCNNYYFQEIITYKFGFDYLNLYFSLGLDGISLFFFILSSLLIFLCVLFVWNETLLKEYIIALLILDVLLLLVFSVLDVLLFYIFFEAILIPMYLLIGI